MAFRREKWELGDTWIIDLLSMRLTDTEKTLSQQRNTCENPCPIGDDVVKIILELVTHSLGKDPDAEIKVEIPICRDELSLQQRR